MNLELYDKVKDRLRKGFRIEILYMPHHKGCQSELNTDIKDKEDLEYFSEALESWWYDDLADNYLVPNDIFGGGEFKFLIKNDELCVESTIQMSSDNYEDFKLFDYFNEEMILFLENSFKGKTINDDYLLFTFDKDGESLEYLEIVYLGENQDQYEVLELSPEIIKTISSFLVNIVDSMGFYSNNFDNGSVGASCNENRVSLTESWTFDFKIKKEE